MTVNRNDLKAFIDGELPNQAALDFQKEIERDESLAQEAAFLRMLGSGVREVAMEPPVKGVDEVLQRFRKAKPAKWPVFAFGGVCLVGLMFLGLVNGGSRSSADVSMALESTKAVASAPRVAGASKAMDLSRETTHLVPPDTYPARAKARASDLAGYSNVNGVPSSNAQNSGSPNGTWTGGSGSRAPAPGESPISDSNHNRMVVQNGDLDEVVHDVSTAETEAMAYTKVLGGYVESSSLTKGQEDRPEADLTLRIPSTLFTQAMNHFKNLAVDSSQIKSLNITGEDVTAQYADTTARAKVLGAEEESYVEMLRHARKLGEILEIKDRLSSVRQEIESLNAQAGVLKKTSDLSRIGLVLEQATAKVQPKPKPNATKASWSSESWSSAASGLHTTVKFLATIGIYLFVYSPIWIPLGLVGIWFYRRTV